MVHTQRSLGRVDVLAANALLLQLFMLFSFFMDGFAYAAEALSGKYHSNGPADGVKWLERALVRIGLDSPWFSGCCSRFRQMDMLAAHRQTGNRGGRDHVLAVGRGNAPLCGFAWHLSTTAYS